ncbi:hypothetical protein [Pseudomonas gregormendelii]
MIGHTTATRQPPPPPPLPINQSTSSGGLKNAITGCIIKTKNTTIQLLVIATEFSLVNAVRENQDLKNISYIDKHTNQNDRITSIGLAVIKPRNLTRNADTKIPMSKTGEQSPRDTLADMKPDLATSLKIGCEYITDLANNDHPFNSTCFSVALGAGYGIKQRDPDTTSIEQLERLSALRIEMLEKSNREGDINLRPMSEKKPEHQPH